MQNRSTCCFDRVWLLFDSNLSQSETTFTTLGLTWNVFKVEHHHCSSSFCLFTSSGWCEKPGFYHHLVTSRWHLRNLVRQLHLWLQPAANNCGLSSHMLPPQWSRYYLIMISSLSIENSKILFISHLDDKNKYYSEEEEKTTKWTLVFGQQNTVRNDLKRALMTCSCHKIDILMAFLKPSAAAAQQRLQKHQLKSQENRSLSRSHISLPSSTNTQNLFSFQPPPASG